MIINKVEIGDLDLFDADVVEKYEKTLVEVENKVKEAAKETKISNNIRKQCEAVFGCFNTLFGEGADKKIFGEKVNLLICLKAFEELVTQMTAQKGELEKMLSKYSPNRAQRRAKKQ